MGRIPRPIWLEQTSDLQRWYPNDRAVTDPARDDEFEIGLVLAGGQSAGCYLAGVLDFLFEALDCWRSAYHQDPERFPNHKVKIKVIAGSSAGGLCAALAAICARYEFTPASEPVYDPGNRNQTNPFYRAWVCDIDMSHLLDTSDLEAGNGGSASVLNSAYLERKVSDFVAFTGSGVADADTRDWLSDPLPLKITAFNLKGVPYQIRFTTAADDSIDMQSHEMVLHRDYNAFMREIFNPAAAPPPDHDCLCERNQPDDPAWKNLGVAALMTIAFPVALAPRYIDRPFTDYEYRFAFPFAPEGVSYAPPLNPDKTTGYHAAAIDGGLVDNEPFGLAHDVLAGTEGHNSRQGALAKRAIVLIDPFPNLGPTGSNKEPLPLLGLFGKIWNALILQNRFKPIDITLAASDTVYSRFMIAPVRRTAEKTVRGNWALASHPLNSFFGYFSGHYRHHDFMLGRYNCHVFLRDWFVLPSEQPVAQGEAAPGNTLFAKWPKPALQNQDYFSTSQLRPGHRQIIPLTGTAALAPQKPEWPRAKFSGYGEIAEKAEKRLRKIAPQLLAQVADAVAGSGVTRWLVYLALRLWWWFSGRRSILRLLQSSVEAATAAIDNDAGAERSPKTAARVAVAATARAPDT